MGAPEVGSRSRILLGTGPRMRALARVLTPAFAHVDVRSLAEIDELETCAAGSALVLDADAVLFEDLGYIRRLLERNGVRLHVTGSDPSQRVARSLLHVASARWMCWPPNLDELADLCLMPHVAAPPTPPAAPGDPREERWGSSTNPMTEAHELRDERLDEIEAIERVLGTQPRAQRARADAYPPAADRNRVERARDSGPALPDMPAASAKLPAVRNDVSIQPAAATNARKEAHGDRVAPQARYFRHQVADLADLAQRIDLTLRALSDSRPVTPERTDEAHTEASDEPWTALGGDVARLVQFTRTLGYLAAPPPPGAHVFDLSEMIEWCVSSLVSSSPRAPRGLFRTTGPLRIRSDRALLAQAFDAVLYLAQSASSAGEIVRVELSGCEFAGRSMARVSIQFPCGPLQGLDPSQIVEPYAVRRMLPDLGPNALSAAVSIIEGQGGSAVLEVISRNRLQWEITLPREPDVPAPSMSTVGQASTSTVDERANALPRASSTRGDPGL